MVKKWLTWINYSLVGLIGMLLLACIYFFLMRPTEFFLPDIAAKKAEIPKGAFTRPSIDYDAIGSQGLDLTFSPLSVQLPDLRRHLVYYGKNSRPDALVNKQVLYFAFNGNKTTESVSPGEKLYVMYDKKQTPPQYIFSPGNEPTPLWIEATAQGSQAVVNVAMKTENGQVIKEPTAYAEFSVPEKFGVSSCAEIPADQRS